MSGDTIIPPGSLAQSIVIESKSGSKARLLYIDNMRVGLISLVIVGHIAITYGAPFGEWYYHEEGQVGTAFAIIATLLLGIGASFLLGLFFMIAGYFTPHPFNRKGPKNFILDRLIRLGIPLILYAVVINPLVTYWAATHGGYQGAFPQYVRTHLPDLQVASIGPLWFVEALLVFSLFYPLGRLIKGKKPGFPSDQSTNPVPANGVIILFVLGLGWLTFLVRIWAPFGWWLEPIHQEPAHFPQYLALFIVGIVAYRHQWFYRISTAQARLWGWIAVALIPLLPILAIAAGALGDEFNPALWGGLTWLSLAYSIWEAFIGLALVITVMVWFRNRFDYQSRLLRAMSVASYAVYVLHPLLIVPLALGLSDIRMNLELKFILVAPLSVAICFLVGYSIRVIPVVKRVF